MAEQVLTVCTVAGGLSEGYSDCRGKGADPVGLDFSRDGGILVADRGNHCIRRVVLADNSPPHVELFAGQSGYRDGDASQALFNYPRSVTVSSDGTVYVADQENRRIRKIGGSKLVSTLAGSGQELSVDGKGELASFHYPQDITNASGNAAGGFYVSDWCCIRHVTEDGTVSTLAGMAGEFGHQNCDSRHAKFNVVDQLACTSSGETYVADRENNAIRCLDADHKIVQTFASGKVRDFKEGTIETSNFRSPCGVSVDADGRCFVADTDNHRIRVISSTGCVQTVSTLVGKSKAPWGGCGLQDVSGLKDGDARQAKLDCPKHLLFDHSTNTLYFTQNHCLRKVSLPRKPLPQLEPSLFKDMLSIVDKQHLSDIVFKINGKPIYASKMHLSVRSEYFDRMFSSGMKESVQTTSAMTEVPIEDVDYESFKALIVYLMTDQLTVDPNDCKMICQLLIVSDQFRVDRLKVHCERLLERQIKADNVFELVHVHVAVSHGAERLKDATLRYMKQHTEICRRPEIRQLPPEFLAGLIQSV